MAEFPSFLDSSTELNDHTEYIVIGIPCDGIMTQKRGSCVNAPDVIRQMSLDLSLTSENGFNLNKLHIVDLGNVSENIEKEISLLLRDSPKSIPIFIGGSHYISYYTLNAILQTRDPPNLHFFSLDAHLDCYDEWKNEMYTHCTVTRRIYEKLGSTSHKIAVIGARDIDLPELKWAQEVDFRFLRCTELERLPYFLSNYNSEKKIPLYLSIDIDVFDPSTAPATGYPIPGGITYRNYLQILEELMNKFTIIAIDIVEYSPELDQPNKMSAFLAAKVIIESLVKIKKEKMK